MKVAVSIRRTIIIHDDVDPFHIDPPAKDIGSDENTLLERLEGGVALDAIDRNEKIIISHQLTHKLRTVPPEPNPSEY
jgi:hypothetical protein